MKLIHFICAFAYLTIALKECTAIWCYRCTSATPGCSDKFNWRGIGYLGDPCPENDDICVKVTEKKGASVTITRDCLSTLRAFRTDMPADHYEGCRKAAKDVRLAHYVFNNTIKELDIRRDYYESTEFCFCFLDHRCNSAHSLIQSLKLVVALVLGSLVVRSVF